MAREIEMKVSIDTTKSEIKLLKLQDELKNLKKEAKSISEDDKAFGQWAEAINSTENEMEKLKQSMKQSKTETNVTTKGFKTLGDKISGAFENAGKKAKRFTLALFSVRTIFSVISKASSNYLSENEQTSNAVAGAWEYLGNVIGPVIERVVSWLRYGIAYLNVFLKALTGVDFLAKSIQKTTAKTNKELKKTVSSMDEIVNLDLDSGSSGANPAGALQEIADLELNPEIVNFMEKLGKAIREVWDFAVGAWNFLEKHFGTTGALAIVAGLGLIIGGASSGLKGLTSNLLSATSTAGGLGSMLSGLATIGAIGVTIALAIEGLDKFNTLIKNIDDYGLKKGVTVSQGQNQVEYMKEKSSDNIFTRVWGELKHKFLRPFYAFASGGFPETGQMFIANEKGPELVGNIGSSTAVVNNNQIVESVAQGVASAVSSVLVQSNNKNSQNASYIYINGSEFAKAIYPDMQAESLRRNTNTSIRRV